jgi:hypothetical protein
MESLHHSLVDVHRLIKHIAYFYWFGIRQAEILVKLGANPPIWWALSDEIPTGTAKTYRYPIGLPMVGCGIHSLSRIHNNLLLRQEFVILLKILHLWLSIIKINHTAVIKGP